MGSGRQLALPFADPSGAAPPEFLPGPGSRTALAWLARPEAWPGGRLALWGEGGTGKTHLLRLWTAERGGTVLAGERLRGLPPAPRAPVAVDDADEVAEEPALLHLLNAAAEAGWPVLLAGRLPPARWPLRLPDLLSRLRAAPAVGLRPPEDAVLEPLLARLLAERQLAVPEGLQPWLLARLPRTGAALREAAARLDHLALANGGRVTRGLAAAVVAELAGGAAEDVTPPASPPGPSLL